MADHLPTGIVVGVDASPGAGAAVRFAAVEAKRRDLGLALVHVMPDLSTSDLPHQVVPEELTKDLRVLGESILADAGAAVAALAPEVSCTRILRTGRIVPSLVETGASARAIVLGHETVPRLRRVYTGAVTLGVSARADAPVVSVPATWEPPGRPCRVVAGVTANPHSAALLEQAFRLAERCGVRLVLVHAWWLPNIYDDRIVTRTRGDAWCRAASQGIEDLLVEYRVRYPGVDVEVRTVHDQAAHALLHAVRPGDILVLARRAHGFPPAAHLGGTARAALRDAACAVMIVPPRDVSIAHWTRP